MLSLYLNTKPTSFNTSLYIVHSTKAFPFNKEGNIRVMLLVFST